MGDAVLLVSAAACLAAVAAVMTVANVMAVIGRGLSGGRAYGKSATWLTDRMTASCFSPTGAIHTGAHTRPWETKNKGREV